MLNPNAFANSAAAGVAVLETAGESEASSRLPFVPLLRTTVNGRWDGPLAQITVTHSYGYTQKQCTQVLEAIYRFPLPGDAAVLGVVVTFGDVEIVAELAERQQAEEAYEQAKREGRQAALTTRETPDVFTLRVAGLQPDQEVVVETTYVQLADAEGTGWSLRIPLTTAPRFTRPDERGHPSAQGQPLATFRDPGHRFALDLNTGSAGSISSTTHALRHDDEDGHLRVRLAQGEMLPDRDCVLHWQPQQAQDRPTLSVLTSDDDAGGHAYFAAMVSPPAVAPRDAAPAREVIVLVDHSGSMRGAKWQAADRAVLAFVEDLSERDYLNVGVFDSDTRWMGTAPQRLRMRASSQVKGFLDGERDGGGTNLGMALEQALQQRRNRGELSRQIVIITDAQVTDEARILKMVEAEAGRRDRRRVSVLCIDAAPNSHLTQQLAKVGGGIARFLTSSPEGGDMEQALKAIIAGWSQPVAVGLRLEVNRDALDLSDATAIQDREGWSAADLGDLTMGRSLWVAGRVPTSGAGDIAFRLRGPSWADLDTSPIEGTQLNSGAIKAVFGAYRVQGLERLLEAHLSDDRLEQELQRLGYDPAQLTQSASESSIYPENAARSVRTTLEDLLLSEALDYGLLCSVTGFVAVRKERGQVVEQTSLIGNALPEGWSGSFAAPQAPASPTISYSRASLPVRRARRAEEGLAMELHSPAAEDPFVDAFEEAYQELEELRAGLEAMVAYEAALAELRQIPRLESLLREMVRLLESIGRATSQHLPELSEQRSALLRVTALLGMGANQDQLSDVQLWLAEGVDQARELVDRARLAYHRQALVNRGPGLDQDARRALDAADRRLDDGAAMLQSGSYATRDLLAAVRDALSALAYVRGNVV